MKRTFTVIAFTVFIWSCAHKSTPTTSSTGTSSNNGSVVNAPATSANKGSVVTAPATGTSANNGSVVNAPATTGKTEILATGTAPLGSIPGAAKSPQIMGQSTYNTKCGKCHGLKVTTDYTADRWISIMQVMAPKAHLDDTEKENVLAYVKANAKK